MVNSDQVTIAYISDGVSLNWAIPYYFFNPNTDLIIQSTNNLSGVVTNLVLNTDYTVTAAADVYGAYPNGGTLVFQPGRVPASGVTITITRKTQALQPDTYPDNNPFPATIIEHDLDRLTLIDQELGASGFLGVLAGPPPSGTAGDWFIVRPFQAGGAFGMCCTVSGTPGTWNPFGLISL